MGNVAEGDPLVLILLDTNVPIYASNAAGPFCEWARGVIADAVSGDGAAINAVSVAELCVGDAAPSTVADRLRVWGIAIVDVPAACADLCATAYRAYLDNRARSAEDAAPGVPLPDFFIGAHAQIMDWNIATADKGRFHTYFPSVQLIMPA